MLILAQTGTDMNNFRKKLTKLLEILTKNEDFMHFLAVFNIVLW